MPAETTLKSRLHHGAARVRGFVTSPWLPIGVAAVAGFLLGRRSIPQEPVIPPAPEPEAIPHALLRAALVTLTTSAIRRVMLGRATETVDLTS